MPEPTLREVIDAFIARDKNEVDAFNGGAFGFGGYRNIEERLAFTSARLVDTMQLLILVANIVAAQPALALDAPQAAIESDKSGAAHQ